jgi:hypothetical protein
MPYRVEKDGAGFRVVNVSTGRVHAKRTSRQAAEAQARLLRGIEHGMKRKGAK